MVLTASPLARYASNVTPATGGIDVGVTYKARRQPDGNWSIFGVEIFNACERPNPGNGGVDRFDEAWLNDAVQNFESRKKSRGYLPPVHLDHHTSAGVSQPFAGYIGRMWVAPNSEQVPSLFADLVDVPADVYARMVGKQLSYRSIEVNNPSSKEVSSLALMSTRVPYHKLPLLRVTEDRGGSAGLGILFEEYGTPDPDTGARYALVQQFAMQSPWSQPTMMMSRMQRYAANPAEMDTEDDFGGYDPDDYAALMQMLGQGGAPDEGVAPDGGEGYEGYEEDDSAAGPEDEGGNEDTQQMAPGAQAQAPMAAPVDPLAAVQAQLDQLTQGMQALGEQIAQVQQGLTSLNQGTAEAQIRPASPPPAVSSEATDNTVQFEDTTVTQQSTTQKPPAKPANKQPAPAAPKAPAAPASPAALTPVQFEALMQRIDALEKSNAALVQFKEGIELQWAQDQVWSELDTRVREHCAKLGEDKYSREQIGAAYKTVIKFLDSDVNNAFTGQIKFEELDGIVGQHFADWRSMTKPDVLAASKPPVADNTSARPRSEAAAPTDAAKAKARAEAVLKASEKHAAHGRLKAAFDANPVQFAEEVAAIDAAWEAAPTAIKQMNRNNADEFARKRLVTMHPE